LQVGRKYVSDMKYYFNPLYVSNFSLRVFNDSLLTTRLNVSVIVKTDFLTFLIGFSIKDKNPATKEYDKVLSRGSFNTCKVQQGVFGGFLGSYVSDIIAEYSNFKLECPYKKGFYYVANAPISEPDLVPGFLTGGTTERLMSLKILAKVPKMKSPAHIYSFDIFHTSDQA